jgi:peptidoglycan/xylan/chitin deacetylase (PgdA/CDA1 family)
MHELSRKQFIQAAVAGGLGATVLLGTADSASAALRHRVLYSLPQSSIRRFAWTIDDGTSSDSVRGYLMHAHSNPKIRYTYFVTSGYPAWRQNRSLLHELIATGQVQLGNHTRTHPDLRSLSNRGIQRALLDCHKFLEDEFSYNAMPFFRPPYGFFDSRVLQAAADVGYTVPVMWYGTFNTEQRHLTVTRMLTAINQWVANGRIVIDHANNPFLANHFDRAYAAISAKNLAMVRLIDAYPELAQL